MVSFLLRQKCKSAILPSTATCAQCELVILDTDCDEWHTFVLDKESKRFEEPYPLAKTVARTEADAKRIVVLNALILRGEPVLAAELPQAAATYLKSLSWNPGFDRGRLSIFMS